MNYGHLIQKICIFGQKNHPMKMAALRIKQKYFKYFNFLKREHYITNINIYPICPSKTPPKLLNLHNLFINVEKKITCPHIFINNITHIHQIAFIVT